MIKFMLFFLLNNFGGIMLSWLIFFINCIKIINWVYIIFYFLISKIIILILVDVLFFYFSIPCLWMNP